VDEAEWRTAAWLGLQGCLKSSRLPVVMLASTEVGTNPLTCRPFPSQRELARQSEPHGHGPRTDQPTPSRPVGGCVTLGALNVYADVGMYVCTKYVHTPWRPSSRSLSGLGFLPVGAEREQGLLTSEVLAHARGDCVSPPVKIGAGGRAARVLRNGAAP